MLPRQLFSRAGSLLLLRQNQPNPNTSSGTCFFASNSQAGSNFIPCGNSAFGVQTCCQAGDNCIASNACFNYRDRITYLAGCTDPNYASPSCPDKGQYGDQQWSGLVICDSNDGTWTNCQESPGAVKVGDANPNCNCRGKPPLFTASSYLAPIAQLPLATGDAISWYSGHTPPSGMTPTAGPSSTTTRRPSSTITTTSPISSRTTSSSSGVSSTATEDDDGGVSSQTQTTTLPPDTTPTSPSIPPPSSSTDAAGAGAAAGDNTTTSTDGLSTGGKIGVGVGVSAGALILIALLVFCFMTMRRKRRQAEFYDDTNQPYSTSNAFGGGGGGSNGMGGKGATYPNTGRGQGQYMPPLNLYPSAAPGSAGGGSAGHGGFGAPSTAAAVGGAGVAAAAAGRRSQDGGRRPSWDRDRFQGQQGQYAHEMPAGDEDGHGHAGYGAAAVGAGAIGGAMAGRRSRDDTGRRPSVDRYQTHPNQYAQDMPSSGGTAHGNAGYGAAAGTASSGRRSSSRTRRPSQDNNTNTRQPNWTPYPPSQQTQHAPPPSSFYNRQRQTQWPTPYGSEAVISNNNNSSSNPTKNVSGSHQPDFPANEAIVSPIGSPPGDNAMRPPSPSPPSSYDYPQHGTNLYVVNPDPSSRSSGQVGHAGIAARGVGKNSHNAPSSNTRNTEKTRNTEQQHIGHGVGGGGSGGVVGQESNIGRPRQDVLYQGQYQQYHQQAAPAVQPQRAEWGYGRSRGQEGLYTGPGGGGGGGGGRTGGIRLVRKSVPDRNGR